MVTMIVLRIQPDGIDLLDVARSRSLSDISMVAFTKIGTASVDGVLIFAELQRLLRQ